MPEVVEVNLTAQFLDYKLKGNLLLDITILKGRYKRHPLHGLIAFKNNKPFKINKIDSKGKFMWFELINDKGVECFLLNRFGLSGEWNFEEKIHSGVMLTIKKQNKNKIIKLYFTDPRNFGSIKLTLDRNDLNKELNKLGPDLLKTDFTNREFYERIKKFILKKDGTISKPRAEKEIVKVLMDQSAKGGIGSGSGNYLTAQILYRAGISPYTKMKKLYEDQKLTDKLADAIEYTIKLAYMTEEIGYMEHIDNKISKFVKNLRKNINENNNHPSNFHKHIKLGNDKFEFTVYRKKKDPLGNDIKGDEIIKGRTTYWSPVIQKLY